MHSTPQVSSHHVSVSKASINMALTSYATKKRAIWWSIYIECLSAIELLHPDKQQKVVFFQKARIEHVKITKTISPESFWVFLDCRLPVLVLEEVVSDILDILSNRQNLFHLNRMVKDFFYICHLYSFIITQGQFSICIRRETIPQLSCPWVLLVSLKMIFQPESWVNLHPITKFTYIFEIDVRIIRKFRVCVSRAIAGRHPPTVPILMLPALCNHTRLEGREDDKVAHTEIQYIDPAIQNSAI